MSFSSSPKGTPHDRWSENYEKKKIKNYFAMINQWTLGGIP